jgi:hypothetical protein
MSRARLPTLLFLSAVAGCTTPMTGPDAAASDAGMDAFVVRPDAAMPIDLGIDAPFASDAPSTGDAPSATADTGTDAGSDAGHDAGSDAGHDAGHDACTPSTTGCPANQCGGTAPDGCGGTITCHADCTLGGFCACSGGHCGGNLCICNPPPCL